jgi:hypothetical protein
MVRQGSRSKLAFDFEVHAHDMLNGIIVDTQSHKHMIGNSCVRLYVHIDAQIGVTADVVITQDVSEGDYPCAPPTGTVKITAINTWGQDYCMSYQAAVLAPGNLGTLHIPYLSSLHKLKTGGWLSQRGKFRFRVDFDLRFDTDVLANDRPRGVLKVLKNMWSDMEFADFALIAQGGEEIKCHRCVLSAASPVLKGMLTSGMREGLQTFVKVEERAEDVIALLRYIYAQEVSHDMDCETLLGLLRLADYYQLPGLLGLCAERLGPLLSEDTIPLVLEQLSLLSQTQNEIESIFFSVMESVRSNTKLLMAVCKSARATTATVHHGCIPADPGVHGDNSCKLTTANHYSNDTVDEMLNIGHPLGILMRGEVNDTQDERMQYAASASYRYPRSISRVHGARSAQNLCAAPRRKNRRGGTRSKQ